ncbi:MAG: hypothetical protein ACK554_07700, partial [Erythrobacteraceae bacterium]
MLPLVAVLSACAAGDTRYPSLAMRPFETAPPPADTAPAAQPTRPLADSAQLAALVSRAVSADAEFARQQAAAGRTRTLKRGEMLFAAGDEDAACATLLSGALKVSAVDHDGNEQIL